MREPVSILPVKHPRYNFVVTYREETAQGVPKRRKKYFDIKKAANEFAVEKRGLLLTHGAKHGHIADEERAALIRYRTWAEAASSTVSLLELVNEAIAAREAAKAEVPTISQLVEKRLKQAERKGSSTRHLEDLTGKLKKFKETFGDRLANEVTAQEIEAWIYRLNGNPVTFANYLRAIGSIFTLAVKHGDLLQNPVKRVDAPKIVLDAPSILTPAQLQKLLNASSEKVRPLLVLQAFAGVRRAEAERLSWVNIHLEGAKPYVEMPSSVTKTNRRRTVELQPNAVAWLKPLVSSSAELLGLDEEEYRKELNKAAATAEVEWERNSLRHSYGTYRMAQTRNASVVAEEMGNSPNIVRTHYQNLVSPEEAPAYWEVFPKEVV
jgi:integrase